MMQFTLEQNREGLSSTEEVLILSVNNLIGGKVSHRTFYLNLQILRAQRGWVKLSKLTLQQI